MTTISEVALGFWTGHVQIQFQKEEASFRRGHSWLNTIVMQLSMVNNAVFQTAKALEAVKSQVDISQSYLPYALPVVTAVACNCINKENHPKLNRVVYFIEDHISNLCDVVTLVSSVALVVWGQYAQGGIVLGYMAYGLAERMGYVPNNIRVPLFFTSHIIADVARLTLGEWDSKILAVLDIVLMVWSRFLKNSASPLPTDPVLPTTPIPTLEELKGMMIDDELVTQFEPVRDNLKAIICKKIPPPPSVNLKDLNTKFETFDWKGTQYGPMVPKKLALDPEWKKRKFDEDPVAYVKRGLEKFVTQIENESIDVGAPDDYERVGKMARHIAHWVLTPSKDFASLSEKQKEMEIYDRAAMLVELGIGGHYCGTGYLADMDDFYNVIQEDMDTLTLKERLDRVYTSQRREIYDSFIYSTSSAFRGFKFFINSGDPHDYALITKIIGSELGIPYARMVEDDSLSVLSVAEQKFFRTLYQPVVNFFWRRCSSVNLLISYLEAVNGFEDEKTGGRINRRIPYDLTLQWFEEKFRANYKTEEEWSKFLSDHIFNSEGEFRWRAICYMLLNEGILRYNPPKK